MKKLRPPYTARVSDGTIAYAARPSGYLWGELPLGAYPIKGDDGTLSRTDGGDPFEAAKFHLPSGRTVLVTRDNP